MWSEIFFDFHSFLFRPLVPHCVFFSVLTLRPIVNGSYIHTRTLYTYVYYICVYLQYIIYRFYFIIFYFYPPPPTPPLSQRHIYYIISPTMFLSYRRWHSNDFYRGTFLSPRTLTRVFDDHIYYDRRI